MGLPILSQVSNDRRRPGRVTRDCGARAMECTRALFVKRRDVPYKRVHTASNIRKVIVVLQVVDYYNVCAV